MANILFSMKTDGKGIPYFGDRGQGRTDGETNHGFRNIKGKPHEAALIEETKRSAALMRALEEINAIDTAFFTAGCHVGTSEDAEGKFFTTGYIEISFNHLDLARDPQQYFMLFFNFNLRVKNMSLGGHLKTGHTRTGQNRPMTQPLGTNLREFFYAPAVRLSRKKFLVRGASKYEGEDQKP